MRAVWSALLSKIQRLAAIGVAFVAVMTLLAVALPQPFFDIFKLSDQGFLILLDVVVAGFSIGAGVWWDSTALRLSIDVADSHEEKLGFSIRTLTATVDKAHPTFNGEHLEWEKKDGTRLPTDDLIPHDQPRFFYPYRIQKTYEDLGTQQERLTVKIIDEANKGAVIREQSHTYMKPDAAKKAGAITTIISGVTIRPHSQKVEPAPKPPSAPTPPTTATPSPQSMPRYAPSSASVTASVPSRPTEITIGIVGKGAEWAKDYKLNVNISDEYTGFDKGKPKLSFSLEEMEKKRTPFRARWRRKQKKKA